MQRTAKITEKNTLGAKIQLENTSDSLSQIAVNDILQAKIKSEEVSGNYLTRINNIEDGKIVIAWPTHRGIQLPVHRDQILEFFFLQDGIPCVFNALIEDTSPEPLPQVTLIPTGAIIQKQCREDFRVKCIVPVEIFGSIETSDLNDAKDSIVAIKSVTYDLSASGFSLRYSNMIPEGILVETKLELPDDGPTIKMPCQVVYSEDISGSSSLYQIGIKYLTVIERERARIVRYLYRMQLESL